MLLRIRGKLSQLFPNACGGIANSLNGAFQFFACHAEVLYPILHLIFICHSNLTTIRHDSLREDASHELLHCAGSARRFPRRTITIDLKYFLLVREDSRCWYAYAFMQGAEQNRMRQYQGH